MCNIAIITARGGSKRIPKKNIKDFLGKPIIAYSIAAALDSKLFDEVMVSTDDTEIADIATRYGAKVPFMRSAKNSNDFAGTEAVLGEVLGQYQKQGKTFQWMCCLYPTAPFVTAAVLQNAFDLLEKQAADALVPVVKFSYPPQRCFTADQGKLRYKWPQYRQTRSQDLETLYHDAGQFYFWQAIKFMDADGADLNHTIPYIMSELSVQDIDNMDDWKLAELKYKAIQKLK